MLMLRQKAEKQTQPEEKRELRRHASNPASVTYRRVRSLAGFSRSWHFIVFLQAELSAFSVAESVRAEKRLS